MRIRNESLNHYLAWLVSGQHFSLVGFSDAEWYCLLGLREGERTGLGQVISGTHGKRLLDVLQRRQHDSRFLFAIPACIYSLPGFAEGQIDWFLGKHGISIEGYERDRITDDLAREAKLYPFIRQLQDMPVVMIGPAPLRGMKPHLRYKRFVEISTPNLHMEAGGIERAVDDAKRYGQPGVYLVSAGVSAAVIIDQLHDDIPSSWFIDCGSIWDAFVGIGGQREWRAKLYSNPRLWEAWKRDNLCGKK